MLARFAGVIANKALQLADWRERPLPAQMLKYAREDTHFLLGIYDRLRVELAAASAEDKGKLGHVREDFTQSRPDAKECCAMSCQIVTSECFFSPFQ